MKSTVLTAVLFLSAIVPVSLGAQVTNEIRDPQVSDNVVTGTILYFYLPPNTSHAYHLDAFNIGAVQKSYKVSKQNVTIMSGASSWFCIFHNGNSADLQSFCYIPSTTTPNETFTTDTGEYNQFICDFAAGPNLGTTVVHYRIFDPNDASDTASFTLSYNVSPASVSTLYANGATLGEAFPNPSNGLAKFNFNLGEAQNASMNVYDTQGRIVRIEAIVRREGELALDLTGLPAGVYSCVLVSSNGISVTRRIIRAD